MPESKATSSLDPADGEDTFQLLLPIMTARSPPKPPSLLVAHPQSPP